MRDFGLIWEIFMKKEIVWWNFWKKLTFNKLKFNAENNLRDYLFCDISIIRVDKELLKYSEMMNFKFCHLTFENCI